MFGLVSLSLPCLKDQPLSLEEDILEKDDFHADTEVTP